MRCHFSTAGLRREKWLLPFRDVDRFRRKNPNTDAFETPKSIEHCSAVIQLMGRFQSDCYFSFGASGGSILGLSSTGKAFLIAINESTDGTNNDQTQISKGKSHAAHASDELGHYHVLICEKAIGVTDSFR